MQRVLIISDDAVNSKMAGPAIRDWEYACALSQHCRVILAIPNESDMTPFGFELRQYQSTKALQEMVRASDVVITSGYASKRFPFLKELPIPLVLSIPHSFVLENMQHFLSAEESQDVQWRAFLDAATVLNEQLAVGDYFVCNSERQRDFWLGMLAALGRVNPSTFSDDPSLRCLVDVVPFGLPIEPPVHRRQVLKGVYEGISSSDRVLFWGGGLYDWLDPLSIIRAMPLVLEKRSDVVLFFAATRHPSPHVEEISPICRRAVRLSDELGLTNQRVFFHDWIPYQERENYLLESDLGLSLHLDHVETRFAFRNRILDYIWAGLPIVASEGDTACDLVRQHRLGSVVGYEDVIGLAQAILELLAVPDLRDEMAPRFADLARNFPWERTTEPLVEFCLNPRSAPDRGVLATDVSPASIAIEARLEGLKQPMSTWAERFSKARHSLRHGGLRSLGREVANYARWKLGR